MSWKQFAFYAAAVAFGVLIVVPVATKLVGKFINQFVAAVPSVG